MTSTAVVILNYNGASLLRQFLPGVIKHSFPARVVVADNASTDESRELLKKDYPEVQLIELDKNYGFSGGYNRALKQVDATYYVLLNSDVEVTPGWLHPLVELLDKHPEIAAVQPKILSYNKPDYFEYAGAAGGFIDALGYPFCRGRVFDSIEKDTGQYNDTRQVFWASGACMLIRSEIYHQLGGLDEDFFAHMEEIDLCWRIIRSGRKVYYCGSSAVYHVGAGTLSYGHPRKVFLNFRNNLRLLIHHLPARQLAWKLPLRLMLDWIAALRFLIHGQAKAFTAVLSAHSRLLTHSSNVSRTRKRLRENLPFNTGLMYRKWIVWEHFILKKKPDIR